MFGVLLAISCKAHGVAGIVIDAGVRTVLESDEDTIPRVLESDFRRRKL